MFLPFTFLVHRLPGGGRFSFPLTEMVDQPLPDRSDVLSHQLRRRRALSLFDGVEHFEVLLQGNPARQFEGLATKDQHLIPHVLEDPPQARVAAGLCQNRMKRCVLPYVAGLVPLFPAAFGSLECPSHPVQNLGIDYRVPYHQRFQSFAKLINFFDVVDRKVRDKGAAPRDNLNQPFRLQQIQGFPDWRLADSETLRKVTLRQVLMAVQLPINNLVTNEAVSLSSEVFWYF